MDKAFRGVSVLCMFSILDPWAVSFGLWLFRGLMVRLPFGNLIEWSGCIAVPHAKLVGFTHRSGLLALHGLKWQSKPLGSL
jgi:hypothetical protein